MFCLLPFAFCLPHSHLHVVHVHLVLLLRGRGGRAVPLVPGESGVRSFCGDHTGRVCVVADGSLPPVKDGTCATPCTEMK